MVDFIAIHMNYADISSVDVPVKIFAVHRRPSAPFPLRQPKHLQVSRLDLSNLIALFPFHIPGGRVP